MPNRTAQTWTPYTSEDLTPHNIFDWRDKQMAVKKGYLTFRLYADGWLVRFTPTDPAIKPHKIEGADIYSACRFANDRQD